MARGDIVVCGGSLIGLSTAMLLARDGHRVTLLEGSGHRWMPCAAVRSRPPADATAAAMAAALMREADVFRGVLETGGCLALPEEVFLAARLHGQGADPRRRPDVDTARPPPGGSLRLVAGA